MSAAHIIILIYIGSQMHMVLKVKSGETSGNMAILFIYVYIQVNRIKCVKLRVMT